MHDDGGVARWSRACYAMSRIQVERHLKRRTMATQEHIGRGLVGARSQPAQVSQAGEPGLVTLPQDGARGDWADAGDAQQVIQRRPVDLDRKTLGVSLSPGLLGVYALVQLSVAVKGQFFDCEIVVAQQPVGLVEAEFPPRVGGGRVCQWCVADAVSYT